MTRFDPTRLSTLRNQAGLSREQLAHAIGATRQAIDNWEAGRYVPSANWLPLMADVLDCTLRDFYTVPVTAGDR